MQRKTFLAAAAALAGALALPLPRSAETTPRIYADGVHDDAAALQWHLDHRVPVCLEGKRLFLGRAVYLGKAQGPLEMHGCKIRSSGKYIFDFRAGAEAYFSCCEMIV